MASRFVLVGLSRLTVRVARTISERDASEIVVLADADPEGLAERLPPDCRVVPLGGDPVEALRAADAGDAACILALAEEERDNLDAALAADVVAPRVPVVLRAFDPVLAARLEEGSNVRRSYSVSRLAAPAFVAAALSDEVLHTLRVDDAELPLLRLRVGSALAGETPEAILARRGVTVLARSHDGGWVVEPGGGPALRPGEEAVVGGELHDVLRLAFANAELPRGRRSRRGPREELERIRAGGPTLLPWIGLALLLLLAANVVVFGVALGLAPVDALYFSVTTAFGDPGLTEEQDWLKVFGVASMIAGGALIGVVFSQLASIATANRLEARAGRRARRLSGHAIVVGLGTVGYRIERLLFELGIPAVVLERDPDTRFAAAVAERTPVLAGDVRVLENLERAGAGRAAMLFACTDDDLTNIAACLQGLRLHANLRAVARVFDDALAERVRTGLGMTAISATGVAATAFAGAALDALARRTFELGGEPWVAMRWEPGREVSEEERARLRAGGVAVLGGSATALAIAGPEEAVARLVPG
jgi:Trk K+ transport system NAD-binding subunit